MTCTKHIGGGGKGGGKGKEEGKAVEGEEGDEVSLELTVAAAPLPNGDPTADAKDAPATLAVNTDDDGEAAAAAAADKVTSTAAPSGDHDPTNQHLTRSIVLVLALSMDSLFEGMALGLKTTKQGAWNLLIAIVAHEIVISFGMGMQLVKHHPRRRVIVIALIYALMTPLGGGVGAVVMETQDGSIAMDTANGILQGLTAGIFIYVTFFEILAAEFADGVTVRRIVMTFAGFVAMALLKAIGSISNDVMPDQSASFFRVTSNDTIV